MVSYLLKFGDFDLTSFVESYSSGVELKIDEVDIPRLNGTYIDDNPKLSGKTISVKGRIFASSLESARSVIEEMKWRLMTLGKQRLYLYSDRWIEKALCKNIDYSIIAGSSLCGIEFDIQFVSESPFWVGAMQSNVIYSNSFSIENNSNVYIEPVIRYAENTAGKKIYRMINTTNGSYVVFYIPDRFCGKYLASQRQNRATIFCQEKKVMLNGSLTDVSYKKDLTRIETRGVFSGKIKKIVEDGIFVYFCTDTNNIYSMYYNIPDGIYDITFLYAHTHSINDMVWYEGKIWFVDSNKKVCSLTTGGAMTVEYTMASDGITMVNYWVSTTPRFLIIGCEDGKIYRFRTSWEQPYSFGKKIYSLETTKYDGKLYALVEDETFYGKVYSSTDRGSSWLLRGTVNFGTDIPKIGKIYSISSIKESLIEDIYCITTYNVYEIKTTPVHIKNFPYNEIICDISEHNSMLYILTMSYDVTIMKLKLYIYEKPFFKLKGIVMDIADEIISYPLLHNSFQSIYFHRDGVYETLVVATSYNFFACSYPVELPVEGGFIRLDKGINRLMTNKITGGTIHNSIVFRLRYL